MCHSYGEDWEFWKEELFLDIQVFTILILKTMVASRAHFWTFIIGKKSLYTSQLISTHLRGTSLLKTCSGGLNSKDCLRPRWKNKITKLNHLTRLRSDKANPKRTIPFPPHSWAAMHATGRCLQFLVTQSVMTRKSLLAGFFLHGLPAEMWVRQVWLSSLAASVFSPSAGLGKVPEHFPAFSKGKSAPWGSVMLHWGCLRVTVCLSSSV